MCTLVIIFYIYTCDDWYLVKIIVVIKLIN
jgi:hypothetical protein